MTTRAERRARNRGGMGTLESLGKNGLSQPPGNQIKRIRETAKAK